MDEIGIDIARRFQRTLCGGLSVYSMFELDTPSDKYRYSVTLTLWIGLSSRSVAVDCRRQKVKRKRVRTQKVNY